MELALLIVRAITLIAAVGFIGTFIWGLIKKWNIPSLITELTFSIIIFIASIIRIILEIELGESWVMSAIIIVLIAINIAICLTLFSEKMAKKNGETE